MSAKFLEGFSGKFAEQWIATLLTPAFVFWAGGCVAAIQRFGWQPVSSWFIPLPEPLQIASLFGIFCVVALSGFVIQRFDLTTLRFLEGYWPSLLKPLQKNLVKRQAKKIESIEKRFQDLSNCDLSSLSPDDRSTKVRLDAQLMRSPSPHDLMPTRLGNLLRATERRPTERYGLDAIIIWPRLWLLLPDNTRKDLQEARADLNTAARIWLWSMLFSLWTPFAWWALPVGILAAGFSYYVWLLDAATTYADLIDATFDLHRVLLYKALRWPYPTDAAAELKLGQEMTEYIWRGSDSAVLQFKEPT
jgi:hypothetical protein